MTLKLNAQVDPFDINVICTNFMGSVEKLERGWGVNNICFPFLALK